MAHTSALITLWPIGYWVCFHNSWIQRTGRISARDHPKYAIAKRADLNINIENMLGPLCARFNIKGHKVKKSSHRATCYIFLRDPNPVRPALPSLIKRCFLLNTTFCSLPTKTPCLWRCFCVRGKTRFIIPIPHRLNDGLTPFSDLWS